MAYWRLFYHFVWTTKNREPLLTPDIEPNVYRFLHAEAPRAHLPGLRGRGGAQPLPNGDGELEGAL